MTNPSEPQLEYLLEVRQAALESMLGPASGELYRALTPFRLGGDADVLVFREFIEGFVYVTADLTGDWSLGQIPNDIGHYELMICTRNEEKWAADLISRLSRYTLEASLNPGETMDFEWFADSQIKALMFARVETEPNHYQLSGRECGILLVIGITGDELVVKQERGSAAVIKKLQEKGVFPFTDLTRGSVCR